MVGVVMIGSGLLGILGMQLGIHPGMSLLPHHHLHFKRVRTKLRLLLLNSQVPALLLQVQRFQPWLPDAGPPPGIERTPSPPTRGNTSRILGVNLCCWQLSL